MIEAKLVLTGHDMSLFFCKIHFWPEEWLKAKKYQQKLAKIFVQNEKIAI